MKLTSEFEEYYIGRWVNALCSYMDSVRREQEETDSYLRKIRKFGTRYLNVDLEIGRDRIMNPLLRSEMHFKENRKKALEYHDNILSAKTVSEILSVPGYVIQGNPLEDVLGVEAYTVSVAYYLHQFREISERRGRETPGEWDLEKSARLMRGQFEKLESAAAGTPELRMTGQIIRLELAYFLLQTYSDLYPGHHIPDSALDLWDDIWRKHSEDALPEDKEAVFQNILRKDLGIDEGLALADAMDRFEMLG